VVKSVCAKKFCATRKIFAGMKPFLLNSEHGSESSLTQINFSNPTAGVQGYISSSTESGA